MSESFKVQPHHLERGAYLYVRQSSMRQVIENVESTKRQYALRGRAIALGWREDQIIVVDSDQGESGASAAWREGFQHLVADVSMGRAGVVMGLEVSRLARNNADWHRLLEICALADTLILDEDGVYDPANFNDRLLLGLKRPDSYCTSCSTFPQWRKRKGLVALSPQPLFAPHQPVPPANITYMLGIEMASESGAVAVGIQLLGDIRIAGVARHLMNPRHGVWRSFQ